MPQFFMNKRLVILLVGIILLVALIGFSLRERDSLSWPEQFIKDTAGFVQTIVAKPAHFVAGFVDNVQDLSRTYEENERLKSRLDEYAQLKVDVERLKQENEELKKILEKEKDLASYKSREASVIARSHDLWNDSLIIDKGEIHGIKKNMAVITADGMIGKIKSVGKTTSTVQLLTTEERTNKIHVSIQGEEPIYGIVEGYDEKQQMLLVKQIPSDKEVEQGMTVMTSGLGGVYPKGLSIGEVVKVEADQYGLTKTAYVKPAANFYSFEHVIVVERMMDQPTDIDESEDGQ
ncbi:rod shape-determining protein MreC [Fervidibacillus halotolerans]|uniref:Cell shape-determining protein MreC n=1 Tax=Fervidibacillus halotolerans TaxID=2980027 RepID=A0A9E8LYG4_9BACI|nr:rod shape-determining protein MreC [Fervidibacillus halotolerans]WAA11585.1 rod shape-determining protein MreC [Fervidibacillus halotolerans]